MPEALVECCFIGLSDIIAGYRVLKNQLDCRQPHDPHCLTLSTPCDMTAAFVAQ